MLRNIRWNDGIVAVACPHCHSKNVKKDGYYRSYQKYFCKQCKKWFNDKTGTIIFHYSHTPLKKWFLILYLFFVLWPGCSNREISLETGISYNICYRFIRTVIEKLSSMGHVKLDGIIEAGFIHEYVNHSQKEYARGDIYVNNCECRSNLYQLWIRKFMGINKYNLQAYSKAFQLIHNIRRMIDRREDRFKQILCHK